MFSLVDKSALIINFEGREVKGLSKGRFDETFVGEDDLLYVHFQILLYLSSISCIPLYKRTVSTV